jgi:hypothetical protein
MISENILIIGGITIFIVLITVIIILKIVLKKKNIVHIATNLPDDLFSNEKLRDEESKDEELKSWRGKKKLSLDKELSLLNGKLGNLRSSNSDSNRYVEKIMEGESPNERILHKELRDINNQLHGYKRPKATIIDEPKGKEVIDKKLEKVETQLENIGSFLPRRVLVKSTVPPTLGHDEADMQVVNHEMKNINRAFVKSDKSLFYLIRNLLPKKKIELTSDEKIAQEEVRRISHKIEGDHPVPPNELIFVENKIKNLKKDIVNQ